MISRIFRPFLLRSAHILNIRYFQRFLQQAGHFLKYFSGKISAKIQGQTSILQKIQFEPPWKQGQRLIVPRLLSMTARRFTPPPAKKNHHLPNPPSSPSPSYWKALKMAINTKIFIKCFHLKIFSIFWSWWTPVRGENHQHQPLHHHSNNTPSLWVWQPQKLHNNFFIHMFK